jgi:hypothetical protein
MMNPENHEIRPLGPDPHCALGGIRTPGRLIRRYTQLCGVLTCENAGDRRA